MSPGNPVFAPRRRQVLACLAGGVVATLAAPAVLRAAAAPLRIEPVATGLAEPWAIGFLPDGGFLITERDGRLRHFAAPGAEGRAVAGLPQVAARGQGGLLDLCIPRDFAQTAEILFSYAAPQGAGAGTALAAARLDLPGGRLADLRVLFRMPGSRAGQHFGGRIAELPDGTLALTIGDRGQRDLAQDLTRHNGKLLRFTRAGGIPPDAPFAGRDDALAEIHSYGHRNPQGMALDAGGALWLSEHGARGGDEVNRIRPGANYGWPVITWGRDYSGAKIGTGTAAPGMEQPAHYWDPSIAPSGHAVCSGRMFPDWAGHHLIGSLKSDHIARLDPAAPGPGGWAQTRIATPETARVRDLREAPDGAIWFLSVGQGAAFRITPG